MSQDMTVCVGWGGGGYPGGVKVSYVRVREAVVALREEAEFDESGHERVREVTEYVDGLGRPLQRVGRSFGGGDHPGDVVTPVMLDVMGRESRRYLPYVDGGGRGDGGFRVNAFVEQERFYRERGEGEE